MKLLVCAIALLLAGSVAMADEAEGQSAEGFVRSVIESLLEGGSSVPFDVASEVIAMDNGEVIPKQGFTAVWPEFAEAAFKKKITADEFFAGVHIRLSPVSENKRIMSNKRLMEAYRPLAGDLYCAVTEKQPDETAFIGYDKAFIYVIRNVDGKWQLIGVGG